MKTLSKQAHKAEQKGMPRGLSAHPSSGASLNRLEQTPAATFLHDRVHGWFELSYAHYLTVPRSVLQSMPDAWQDRFVTLLEEMDDALNWRPAAGSYWVTLKDDKGRFVRDPLMDYERGRRRISLTKRTR